MEVRLTNSVTLKSPKLEELILEIESSTKKNKMAGENLKN